MLGQVVAAHETALAHGTGKPLLSRVGPAVARQLVRAGELPLAAFPLAFERLLTCGETASVFHFLLALASDWILFPRHLVLLYVSPVCVLMWALRWELLK